MSAERQGVNASEGYCSKPGILIKKNIRKVTSVIRLRPRRTHALQQSILATESCCVDVRSQLGRRATNSGWRYVIGFEAKPKQDCWDS